MRGWATVAWPVGMAAALTMIWMGRRWRRYGADTPAGSRVARHRFLYYDPTGWQLLLAGILMASSGVLSLAQGWTGRRHTLAVAMIVLGAVALLSGVGWQLLQRRWNRSQAGRGTGRRRSP